MLTARMFHISNYLCSFSALIIKLIMQFKGHCAKPWPHSDIRSCCHRSLHAFTSFNWLHLFYEGALTRDICIYTYVHTYIHTECILCVIFQSSHTFHISTCMEPQTQISAFRNSDIYINTSISYFLNSIIFQSSSMFHQASIEQQTVLSILISVFSSQLVDVAIFCHYVGKDTQFYSQ